MLLSLFALFSHSSFAYHMYNIRKEDYHRKHNFLFYPSFLLLFRYFSFASTNLAFWRTRSVSLSQQGHNPMKRFTLPRVETLARFLFAEKMRSCERRRGWHNFQEFARPCIGPCENSMGIICFPLTINLCKLANHFCIPLFIYSQKFCYGLCNLIFFFFCDYKL